MIEIGQIAPVLEVVNDLGEVVDLKEVFREKYTVLYFYPKDMTPGCTQQAKDFNDHMDAICDLQAQVIGVSTDSVSSHQRFKKKYGLQFNLIADDQAELCQLYNVYKEKKNFGKVYQGICRSTFLIDKQGCIVNMWFNVKVPGHVDEVVNYLTTV